MDADIAGAPHQVVHDGAMQDLEPSRSRRLADHDLRDVVGLRIGDDVVGDAPVAARDCYRLAAEALGEPQGIGDSVALFLGELQGSPGLDRERGEWRVQAIRQPLGVANEPCGERRFADAHKDALACRPWSLQRAGLQLAAQLLVDALGGAAQRQFAQRGEIGRREEVLERALGLLRHVNLAVLQPLDQVARRQVDQFDRVGAVEDGVRHGLAHPHMGDLRDDVVQALDVLDVDGGVDVDAVVEQLLDIEIAFRMPAAGCVGMGEFIDQGDLRPPRLDGVDVHLVESLAAILDVSARDDFEPFEQGFGLLAAVGLDHPDHDVIAVLEPGAGLVQHFVGLADAGSRADEDLQLTGAALLAPGCFKQRLRRGPLIVVVASVRHLLSQEADRWQDF